MTSVWCHNDFETIKLNPQNGQINENTSVGKYIIKLISENKFNTLLDIGTWTGNGSTRCMLKGLQQTIYDRFISVECNQDKTNIAHKNLELLLNKEKDTLLWGSIVSPDEVSLANVYEIFPDVVDSSEFQRWHQVDLDNIKISPNILDQIPEELDLVLFDGGEFTTYFEFKKLFSRCKKYILMDDCDVAKCKLIREFMKSQPDWNEITYISERNGFCAFKKNTLNNFLMKMNVTIIEGYSQQLIEQTNLLKYFAKDAKNILEIGFNGGHSAEIFLDNSKGNLTSLDLGCYNYVFKGKEYIDRTYPGRHKLVIGDSRKTIKELPLEVFDLIFIDGGHDYDIAKSDLYNCKSFSNENTIILMDDIVFKDQLSWNIGPTNSWLEGLNDKLIIESQRWEFERGRGMCCGKYLFNPKI